MIRACLFATVLMACVALGVPGESASVGPVDHLQLAAITRDAVTLSSLAERSRVRSFVTRRGQPCVLSGPAPIAAPPRRTAFDDLDVLHLARSGQARVPHPRGPPRS